MTPFKITAAAAFACLFAASIATAQQPKPVRIRATIQSVDGRMLTVKGRDGETMKVKVADKAPVNEIVKASLSNIKEGSYLAITAMPQPDGSQKAMSILIFPQGVHPPEGFNPWDYSPNSTMTNATVAHEVTGVDGATLNVKYKDGGKTIVVPPNTEIVTTQKATAAALKPGQKIFVFAAKAQGDGTFEAPSLAFGDYGVWR